MITLYIALANTKLTRLFQLVIRIDPRVTTYHHKVHPIERDLGVDLITGLEVETSKYYIINHQG